MDPKLTFGSRSIKHLFATAKQSGGVGKAAPESQVGIRFLKKLACS
jgi:hypothetical protein